jgi:hypothetical protein
VGRKSYRDLKTDSKKLAEERLISHIGSVEATMVGFFATAITFLLFPLALYTPDVPVLIYLASLGYICSWMFLYAIIAGICMRILALSKKWDIDYNLSMKDLTGHRFLAPSTVIVAMAACIFMMVIPPVYVLLLTSLWPTAVELVFSFQIMFIACIFWIAVTFGLAYLTIWKKPKKKS